MYRHSLSILLILLITTYSSYAFSIITTEASSRPKSLLSLRSSLLKKQSWLHQHGDDVVVRNRLCFCRNRSCNRIQMTNDKNNNNNIFSELITSRLPTSVDDQVRQAIESMKRATADGKHRHILRLLLPVIGATELDDWPGGSRQQMEAANPLVQDIIQGIYNTNTNANNNDSTTTTSATRTVLIDESDGVAAIFAQGNQPSDDSCTVLLPTADTVTDTIQTTLEQQVGKNRNLILVNPQWRRKSDFGGITTTGTGFFSFGSSSSSNTRDKAIEYVEQYIPTFSLTNFICEGESIRVLRTYPGPWRVFIQSGNLQQEGNDSVNWTQIGSKDVMNTKPMNWDTIPENQRDGGLLYNYGQPSYQEIQSMILSSPNYKPKNPAERAAAAFNFIKDTL